MSAPADALLHRRRSWLFSLGAALLLVACFKDDGPVAELSAEAVPPQRAFTAADVEVYQKARETRHALCPELCEKSEKLGCSLVSEKCLEACSKLDETIVCPTENEAFVRCQLAEPEEHLSCGQYGFPILGAGFCSKEVAALSECARAATRR